MRSGTSRRFGRILDIAVAKSVSQLVLPPADFSIVNLPESEKETREAFQRLYDTPSSRHVSLVLFRGKRGDRLGRISNYSEIPDSWGFLDSVFITYDKPSTCSNNGFLPLAEMGQLIYKGPAPDTKKTSWFRDGRSNATNLWDLSVQAGEAGEYSYHNTFNWEMMLLLMSMSGPMETRRFIYGLPINKAEFVSMSKFCEQYDMSGTVVVETQEDKNYLMKAIKGE